MKYEFTGETKLRFGIILKRIRATAAIEKFNVAAGDLGGWIEDEKNLDQSGDAWVSGDARVYGNAQVCGDAQVYGDARVYGDAWEKSPLYIQGTKYAFYMATANKVGCGCQVFTFAGWHKFWRKIAAKFGMTEAEQAEYVSYFNLACERYGKLEFKIDLTDGSGDEEPCKDAEEERKPKWAELNARRI